MGSAPSQRNGKIIVSNAIDSHMHPIERDTEPLQRRSLVNWQRLTVEAVEAAADAQEKRRASKPSKKIAEVVQLPTKKELPAVMHENGVSWVCDACGATTTGKHKYRRTTEHQFLCLACWLDTPPERKNPMPYSPDPAPRTHHLLPPLVASDANALLLPLSCSRSQEPGRKQRHEKRRLHSSSSVPVLLPAIGQKEGPLLGWHLEESRQLCDRLRQPGKISRHQRHTQAQCYAVRGFWDVLLM